MFPRSRSLPAFLATSSFTLALVGCTQPTQDDPRIRTPLVRVATAIASGQAEGSYSGVVVARVESDLGFRVAGKIVERLVDTGQVVKAGQPLMRIDSTDLALATRAKTEAVNAARAHALQAAADEKRLADLVSAGAVSASAYDQAKAAADSAKALLSAAEAQADVARNEAGYAALVADVSGVVMETRGEPGQVVGAGQTVVRLAKSGPREAIVNLPETVRPAIGSTGHAAVFGDLKSEAVVRLRQLSDTANPLTRTFDARYVLDGPAADTPLGSTVTVRLTLAADAGTLQVPLAALYDPGKGPGVWIVDGSSHLAWRGVKVVGLGDETATVSGGLKPGERYVALGAHLLHEGEAVRVASVVEARQ